LRPNGLPRNLDKCTVADHVTARRGAMYKRLKLNDFPHNFPMHANRRQMHHGYLNQILGIRDQVDELI
jgi:hypothetical protein